MSCLTCKDVLHGAIGLTKVVLGIEAAPVQVIEERRNKCRDCDHATKNPARMHTKGRGLTTMSRCKLCDCFIMAKTQVSSESCPDGRWKELPHT